jgi:hypothetical protein
MPIQGSAGSGAAASGYCEVRAHPAPGEPGSAAPAAFQPMDMGAGGLACAALFASHANWFRSSTRTRQRGCLALLCQVRAALAAFRPPASRAAVDVRPHPARREPASRHRYGAVMEVILAPRPRVYPPCGRQRPIRTKPRGECPSSMAPASWPNGNVGSRKR